MINSRAKGARNERSWAAWLKDSLGIHARRGQQFCGGAESPDVVSDLNIHWEVKAVQNLNIEKAMDQAVSDCQKIKDVGEKGWSEDPKANSDMMAFIPAVAHKKNFRPWLVTIRATDLVAFCREIISKVK